MRVLGGGGGGAFLTSDVSPSFSFFLRGFLTVVDADLERAWVAVLAVLGRAVDFSPPCFLMTTAELMDEVSSSLSWWGLLEVSGCDGGAGDSGLLGGLDRSAEVLSLLPLSLSRPPPT